MDLFMEYLVQKKKDTKDKLLITGLILGGIILTIVLFYLMLVVRVNSEAQSVIGQMVFSIGFLLVAGVWYGVYLLKGMMNIEYEYIVTNNELDIDKVMSKRGRKHLITVDVKNVKLMARTDDEACNDVYKNPPQGVKVFDYGAMNENLSTFFADCTIDETRTIVVFQATEKMIDALWKYNPRAIKKYDR